MNVIQANARSKITSADVDFILDVLAPQQDASQSLVALFADEASRDLILDNESLFRVLLDKPDVTNVSPHFYFYVLVRHVLRKAGIDDREVADYVAEVLATFSSSESVFHARSCPMQSLVDMLAALQEADETGRFNIQSHIANYSLFLSGLFLNKRQCCGRRRAAPGIAYYEQVGSANFRLAGDHRLACRYHLESVYATLASAFHDTRLALNELSERFVSVGEPYFSGVDLSVPAAV